MDLPLTEQHGIQIIKLTLPYLDSSTVPKFKSSIPYDSLDAEKIILDLSDLQFIDSTGLGSIIILNTYLLDKGQRLSLVSASDQIKSVFSLVKMHKLMPIFIDIDEAIEEIWT